MKKFSVLLMGLLLPMLAAAQTVKSPNGNLRELIAQAHTIVIDTETNGDVALGRSLVQVDLHLIVVVADGGSLSPYRFPSLIKGGSLAAGLGETVHQVSLLHAFAGMLVLC